MSKNNQWLEGVRSFKSDLTNKKELKKYLKGELVKAMPSLRGIKRTMLSSDQQRIKMRYDEKIEEYEKLSLEELKPLLNVKMSSTDRFALKTVIDIKTDNG